MLNENFNLAVQLTELLITASFPKTAERARSSGG